jgi:hypothetical protein
MFRLIKTDLAATGKRKFCDPAPARLFDLRALDALLFERGHFGFQIVAHKVEFVRALPVARMNGGFCGRQAEDEPAMSRIHGFEAEDIAEKRTIGLGVIAVEDDVSAKYQ